MNKIIAKPQRGDWLLWRPDRKSNGVKISVYDEEIDKYKVLTLEIDMSTGDLVQIVDGSKEYVGRSLWGVLEVKHERSQNLSLIKYHYPEADGKKPLLLNRQVVMAAEDYPMVTKEVFSTKKWFVLLFLFELFDWMVR
jgi:hypothetical protein